MSASMLIINYQPSDAQRSAGLDVWSPIATHIASIDGLRWKYWLVSKDQQTRGGVYLFDSEEQANDGKTQLEASLRDAGASEVHSQVYGIDVRLSAITRGAVD